MEVDEILQVSFFILPMQIGDANKFLEKYGKSINKSSITVCEGGYAMVYYEYFKNQAIDDDFDDYYGEKEATDILNSILAEREEKSNKKGKKGGSNKKKDSHNKENNDGSIY